MTESSPRPPAARPSGIRPDRVTVLSAVVALAVGAGAAVWWLASGGHPGGSHARVPGSTASGTTALVATAPRAAPPGAPAARTAALVPPPAPPGAAPMPAAAGTPRFDIVRIEPGGHAVIAGRAAPDAVVAVLADGHSLGSTRADSSGNWLLLPDRTLPPGPASLTLSAALPGGAVLAGRAPLRLTVPAAPAPAGQVPGAGAAATPVVLASKPTASAHGVLPSSTSRAHPPYRPPYRTARWRNAEPLLAVRPGQSLWRIARLHYGKGEDYPTIYQANRAEIANPNLIFPGQTFALPPKPRHPPRPPAR